MNEQSLSTLNKILNPQKCLETVGIARVIQSFRNIYQDYIPSIFLADTVVLQFLLICLLVSFNQLKLVIVFFARTIIK